MGRCNGTKGARSEAWTEAQAGFMYLSTLIQTIKTRNSDVDF